MINLRQHRREWATSLGLLGLALLFHLYFILRDWQRPVALFGDAVHYDHAAVLLLLKHVYTYWSWGPAAQVTPGYPIFLEISYWITLLKSHNHQVQMHVAQTLQHVIAAVTVLILYRLMRTALPRWVSLIGAILWLIYPPDVYAADQLLTETLYVFFLVLFVWVFIEAVRYQTFWHFVLAGLVLGLLTLVRPSVMPLFVAPLILLLQRQSRAAIRRHLRNWSGYAGMFILTMLPWWIRNVVVIHSFILTDQDAGNPLLFGSDPNFQHDTGLANGLNPAQQKAAAIHRIITGFHTHPFSYLKWYTVDKIGLLFGTPWYSTTLSGGTGLLTRLSFYYVHTHLVWVFLGLIGLIIGAWRRRLWWVSALTLFLIVVQLPFIPINRYVFPVMPFFFVGVATFLEFIVRRMQRGRGEAVPNTESVLS